MPRAPFARSGLDSPGILCQAPTMNAQVSPLLDIELGRSGLLAQSTLVAEKGKELTIEDLGLLAATKVGGTQVLKKIRASHHQAARLLAQGVRAGEVSALTGFCSSRISVLQADPAFEELVRHYASVEESRFADVQERMVTLGLTASEEIIDRLETEPELISSKELVDIVKAALDRGGHAPVTKSESKNLSVVLGAEDLAAMKAHGGSTILDKATIHGKVEKEINPQGGESPVGETSPAGSLGEQEAEGSRLPGEGASV